MHGQMSICFYFQQQYYGKVKYEKAIDLYISIYLSIYLISIYLSNFCNNSWKLQNYGHKIKECYLFF